MQSTSGVVRRGTVTLSTEAVHLTATNPPMSLLQGLATARSINAVRYLECSAKHNRGVNECFEQAAKVAMSGKNRYFQLQSAQPPPKCSDLSSTQ
jgi:hypothetical protein